MKELRAKELIEHLNEMFTNNDRYLFYKKVHEFIEDKTFHGDTYNFVAYEKSEPPTFYVTFSPYDVVSKKAPDHGLVFRDGKAILNLDFAEYTNMRTGVMDAFVLKSIGVNSLARKRIALFGSGKTAQRSLQYLKETYPDLSKIDFTNKSKSFDEFVQFAHNIGVEAHGKNDVDFKEYDYLLFHTSTGVVLPKASEIKDGAVICTYRSTPGASEVHESFYDTQQANVILDWDYAYSYEEVKLATEKGMLDKESIVMLGDIVSEKKKLDSSKSYTIFKSNGTPMQNAAVLKILLKNKSS